MAFDRCETNYLMPYGVGLTIKKKKNQHNIDDKVDAGISKWGMVDAKVITG